MGCRVHLLEFTAQTILIRTHTGPYLCPHTGCKAWAPGRRSRSGVPVLTGASAEGAEPCGSVPSAQICQAACAARGGTACISQIYREKEGLAQAPDTSLAMSSSCSEMQHTQTQLVCKTILVLTGLCTAEKASRQVPLAPRIATGKWCIRRAAVMAPPEPKPQPSGGLGVCFTDFVLKKPTGCWLEHCPDSERLRVWSWIGVYTGGNRFMFLFLPSTLL